MESMPAKKIKPEKEFLNARHYRNIGRNVNKLFSRRRGSCPHESLLGHTYYSLN